jgi:hypothetical protein
MPRLKHRPRRPATDTTLSRGSEERIHKLVLRAVQCSFGVEPSLRRAVQLGAREMREAGASFRDVRQAIAQCVLSHPSVLPDKLSLMTGESYASAILKRMLAWTDNDADVKQSKS